jgi:hypothetical protein
VWVYDIVNTSEYAVGYMESNQLKVQYVYSTRSEAEKMVNYLNKIMKKNEKINSDLVIALDFVESIINNPELLDSISDGVTADILKKAKKKPKN